MGDPGGVGAEITIKAWKAVRHEPTTFFVIDDPDRLRAFNEPIETITSPAEAADVFSSALPILPLGVSIKSNPGLSLLEHAPLVIASIERAVSFCLNDEAAGVVTNPIQKSTLMETGFSFSGHTEFLADLTKDAPMPANRRRGPVMLLAGPQLRTTPVSVHTPLSEAIKTLTTEGIVHTAIVTAEALTHEFGIAQPRLAVSGLNPHAGENGAIGLEDQTVISPAIDALKNEGVNAFGPLPADSMFHAEARAAYDAAICMYHDQALIPVKTLAFDETVNVTLGLPIIRTSPDHGTALDIAGKNTARPDSLVAAIRLAGDLARRRHA